MKKKKKKKQSDSVLILALVGGGLLVVGGVVLVVVLNTKSPNRDQQAQANDKDKQLPKDNDKPKFEPKPKMGNDLIGKIRRRVEITEVQNNLRELGKAIYADSTINGKGTASYKDLGLSFANNPVKGWIDRGWVKVVWSANLNNLPNGASKTALAWETEADSQGLRVVVMCDASVQTMDEQTFQNTPKAMGR
jgi:hypothetical protein